MSQLHESMQRLNGIFQNSKPHSLPVTQFYEQLCSSLRANIYLFSLDGTILERASTPDLRCPQTKRHTITTAPDGSAFLIAHDTEVHEDCRVYRIGDSYLNTFHQKHAGVYNLYEKHPICDMAEGSCTFTHRYYNLIPIYSEAEKEAGILFVRYGRPFTDDEICLCEYAALFVSLELSFRAQVKIKKETWERAAAGLAVKALSDSELRVIDAVLSSFEGSEGDVVLSDIAKQNYVAKSLLTGILRKLEGAGVISTRAMGPKGTRIAITNSYQRFNVTQMIQMAQVLEA